MPTYAVPRDDVAGEIVAAPPAADDALDGEPATRGSRLGSRSVYDPSVPFAVHTTEGEAVTIRVPGGREAAAFRPSDSDLADYVLLAFDAFDAWYEEDERNVVHPRNRSAESTSCTARGTRGSSSTVRCWRRAPRSTCCSSRRSRSGTTSRPTTCATDLLAPSDRLTYCAYKGEASYWSVGDEQHLAWCYRHPLRDASEIVDRIAFFNERVDLIVDGVRQERPITPWSPQR